jgi:hypothetical protein
MFDKISIIKTMSRIFFKIDAMVGRWRVRVDGDADGGSDQRK